MGLLPEAAEAMSCKRGARLSSRYGRASESRANTSVNAPEATAEHRSLTGPRPVAQADGLAVDSPFLRGLLIPTISPGSSSGHPHAILEGYAAGLRAPKPFVLDRDHRRMREIFVASEGERADFWKKMDGTNSAGEIQPKQRYLGGLLAAMLDADVQMNVWPRTAGTGSLGRSRWVALAEWKGGPVVREAKAVVPSAWGRVRARNANKIAIMEIARGRYRASDPWYRLTAENVNVRRLSPNARKIEIDKNTKVLLEDQMLEAMGRELANVHLGVADRSTAIQQDLKARGDRWLVRATEKAAETTKREFDQWNRD